MGEKCFRLLSVFYFELNIPIPVNFEIIQNRGGGGGPSGLKNGSFQDNFWIGFEKKLLNLFHLILALGGNTLKIFHSTKKDMFSSLGHITLKGKINFDFKIENQKLPTEGGSMHLNAMGEI